MKFLTVKNLSVELDNSLILKGVSFDLNQGEVLAIIGPNGAGKTILLKTILGMIKFKGEIIWHKKPKIGYVPQRFEIETDLPLKVKEFFNLKKIPFKNLLEIFNLLGLNKEILNQGFGKLSIGQRQRVLVAWAMADNPDLLLFDEPTADIDIVGQNSVYNLIAKLQKEKQLSAILISHDLNVVYQYADKVLCLNRTNVCFGSPKQILTPEKLLEVYGKEKSFYVHKH